MLLKTLAILLVLVKVTFGHFQIQDLYNENVAKENAQQTFRRCSRQTSNLPTNIPINSNVPLSGLNSGVSTVNSLCQNVPHDNIAANLLQNVNNSPLSLPSQRGNNFPNNRLLSNTNGITNNGWSNVNNLPVNGLQNFNNFPYSLPNGNRMTSNLASNFYNEQVNNGMPLNRLPRTSSFLNKNTLPSPNLLSNYNGASVPQPTNLQNFNSFSPGSLDSSSSYNLPRNTLNNNLPNNFLRTGNYISAPNFPQNNFPMGNALMNSFNSPSSNELSNLQFITSGQTMLSNFPNNNGEFGYNIPPTNNNYLTNNVLPLTGNNVLDTEMPYGNIINPFMIHGNMPLHTVVPNLNNLAGNFPGNGLSNSAAFSNIAKYNNPFLNEVLFDNYGGSLRGLSSNNLPIVSNSQYDLAGKQNIMQNHMPSFSNFQQERQLDLANSFNMGNNIQMDGLSNLAISNELPISGLSDAMSTVNNLFI